MKRRFFTFFAALLAFCFVNTSVSAQAVGDYGSTKAGGTAGTMDWLTGTWYKCVTAGTWAGATTTTTAPTATTNVWILAGDVVNLTSATSVTGKCNNLEVAGSLTLVDFHVENSQIYGNIHVASTGTITANPKLIWGNYSTSPMTLTVDAGGKFYLNDQFKPYGSAGAATTITNNGILGIATKTAGSGATIYMINQSSAVGNSNVIFTGTGTTIFRRLFADTNAGSFNITFDQDVTFTPLATDPGIKLQNASGVTSTSTRSITINPGKTVTIYSGWFANTAAFTGADANNTYNINGTLDASNASIYFGTTSNTSYSTNSQIINIGSAGVLKCGAVISVNKPQAGQTLAVNVVAGGTITYPGTAYQTFPAASTFSVTASPYALLTNSNSNVSLTNASGASVVMNSDMTVDKNLTLAGATTLTGASNLSVNGTLSLGGKLTNNIGNITLGSSSVFSGSSTNYIDLSSGGSLTRNGVTTSATVLPIGAGSYTPITITNTAGTPNITAKVKVGSDNAVEDATKIVNLQWSLIGSAATTADVAFQFNGTNKASAFDVAATCDLGNYTATWASTSVNTPSGTDPYTISATGLTIPTSNNLYVIGNTGKVVRLAPTSTIWSGAVSTDWAIAGNWSNGVPDNTLDAVIPASLTNYPVISASQDIKNLTVASGASLTNNGTLNVVGPQLSVNGSLLGNGMYQLSGASAQTITGAMSVNHLTLNNNSGVINNGSLTINTDLTIIAGAITGTAPVYSVDMPVTFIGSATSLTGLALSPSTGNVGALTINAAGTLTLSNTAQVKNLILTLGTLNNSTNNITVSGSVTRLAGTLATAPAYTGAIPVSYIGTNATNSGYEISPTSGSISVFTLSGSDVYTIANGFTSTGDINVTTGTLRMASNVAAQNVTVATGAVLNSDNTATSAARHTLTVGNGTAGNDATLTVDGTLGNTTKWANDGIDIEVSANAKTFTVNGAGFIGISGMRPAADANSRTLDITINKDLNLDRDNGGAGNIEPTLTLQNGTCTYGRTLTIASGATVYFRGNGALHGMKNASSSTDELVNNYASSSSNQGNCTYNIYGTLDLASSYTSTAFNLNTCSYAGNTQAVIVNVKNGGVLKLSNVVKMFTALSGQTADIVTEKTSKVVFGYNATQYNILTGNGTIPTLNIQNLDINNTSGVNLTKPLSITGTLTLTAGAITGSAVVMNGTEQQTITANGNTIENLTINNATGVLGAPSVTGTLTVTKGDVLDYSNLSNCNVLFNGATAQTASTGLSTVKNLTVNNANGVSLAADLTVNGVLTLTSGRLKTGNYNVNIWTSGSVAASNSAYVETSGTGLLVMNTPASTSTVFPVGTSTGFNPVTLNPADAGKFYVRVNDGNTPALPTNDATVLPTKSLNRTWNITPSVPTTATLTFGYNGSTDANVGFDNSGVDVALLHNNISGNWEYVGTGSVIPGIGSTTAKTTTIEKISNFSPFTIANPGPGAVYVNSGAGTFSDIFRSKANGNWGSSTTWELYDVTTTTWQSTVLTPTETSTVTIQNGDTVTLTSQSGVGNLIIESGAKLAASTSAYTASPFVLSIGKTSSVIRNNGLLGCAIGSVAGTVGDGITLSIAPNCVSFSLTGTGITGIGSLYAEAGSNNLTAVIDQNVQFRRTTASGKQVALSMIAPSGTGFSGSRMLIINKGKNVSFLNGYSCLHSTAFSSAGSNSEQQGDITYDIQGNLDLKGGNVYITSSSSALSSAQKVKLNVGKNSRIVVGGDFNICKVQATQAVYVNLEDSAIIDASGAATTVSNFYGPSTNATTGYGSNYVWIITNGNSSYSRNVGNYSSKNKYFNVAVAPSTGDYVNLYGNPVYVGNNIVDGEVYTVSVNSGQPYPFTAFSSAYAINRTWKVIPTKLDNPYGATLIFGYTGTTATDANTSFYTIDGMDLLFYIDFVGNWSSVVSPASTITPATGTFGTAWQYNYFVGNYAAPYLFTLRNKTAPRTCN